MNEYDVHVDNKGRLLLPKQIRKLFLSGARIVCDEYSNKIVLEPLTRGQVAAEFESAVPIYDLLNSAWKRKVAIRPTGASENGNGVLRAYGQYDDVRDFLEECGCPKEDFEEHLLKEGE